MQNAIFSVISYTIGNSNFLLAFGIMLDTLYFEGLNMIYQYYDVYNMFNKLLPKDLFQKKWGLNVEEIMK